MIRGADGDGRGNFEGRLMMTGSSPLYRPLFATLALAVACSVGSPLLAEQEPASEETGQTKEEKAAAEETSKNEYSEEIFVKGSAGTSALSSSVATKMDVPLRLTPASVSVVTRALSEEQNAVTVSDALRNTSGVNVQSNFGQHDFFIVRGFDSLSGGLVLTDGLAEPEATFYHLYNVERVEVLKGPGGFLYGTNALAGTVNLLRLKPAQDAFWGAEVGGGSFDTYDAAFDANFGGDVVRFRLNGLWRESDGYRDGRESEIAAFNPVLDFTLGDEQLAALRRRGAAQRRRSGRRASDLRRRELRPAAQAFLPVAVRRLRAGRHAPAPPLGDRCSMERGRSATAPTGPSSTGRARAPSSTASSRSSLVPDGLFVARTLVALDDDQTLVSATSSRSSAAARTTTGCSGSRSRSATTSSPSFPASSRSSASSIQSRPRPRGRRPFPASARPATPSGRSSRPT